MDIFEFLEEAGSLNLLTNPRTRNTNKKTRMTSAFIQASRDMRKNSGRVLTEEEKIQVIRDTERTYNREMRWKRKATLNTEEEKN